MYVLNGLMLYGLIMFLSKAMDCITKTPASGVENFLLISGMQDTLKTIQGITIDLGSLPNLKDKPLL